MDKCPMCSNRNDVRSEDSIHSKGSEIRGQGSDTNRAESLIAFSGCNSYISRKKNASNPYLNENRLPLMEVSS
jgi:hypothetical protein